MCPVCRKQVQGGYRLQKKEVFKQVEMKASNPQTLAVSLQQALLRHEQANKNYIRHLQG